MEKKIIEISQDDYYLSLKRGFIIIEQKDLKTSISIDDIFSLVISANNSTISKNLINEFSDRGANIILCGKDYMPKSLILPYSYHWQAGERIRKQVKAKTTLQKSLWKSIIKEKIKNQARVLEWHNPKSDYLIRLKRLYKTVKSGDPENHEAQAAQIYFKALFGKGFIRDRNSEGINSLLNYVYIVLRSCVARAVTGSGLLPALGIIHTNKLNPYTLVDDLMEPYRPIADSLVIEIIYNSKEEIRLTTDIKRNLAGLLSLNLISENGYKSLPKSLLDTANSLAKSYMARQNYIKFDQLINNNEIIR